MQFGLCLPLKWFAKIFSKYSSGYSAGYWRLITETQAHKATKDESVIQTNNQTFILLLVAEYSRDAYLGWMNALANVLPKGASFGILINTKKKAVMWKRNPDIITGSRPILGYRESSRPKTTEPAVKYGF